MAFHKKAGLRIKDMVKSNWVYRKLRNFRAGIEFDIDVSEARLWSGALRLARARPLQGLRLVLCRRVQPRSLRPAQAGLTSRLPPRPHRDWPSPGRTPIPIFRKSTAGSAHATATANEMAPKRPSSSPNAIDSGQKIMRLWTDTS